MGQVGVGDTVGAVWVDMVWAVWVDMVWVDIVWEAARRHHRISLAATERTILLTRIEHFRIITLTGSPVEVTASLITGTNSVTAMAYETGLLIAEIVHSIVGIGSEIAISIAISFSGIISSSVSISRRLASLGGEHGIRGGGIQIMPIILTMTIRRVLEHNRVRDPKQVLDHNTARSIGTIWPCLCNPSLLSSLIIEARSTA
jgi:hypothetical protein